MNYSEEQIKKLAKFIHKQKLMEGFSKDQLFSMKDYELEEICETVRHNMTKKQLNSYIDILLFRSPK